MLCLSPKTEGPGSSDEELELLGASTKDEDAAPEDDPLDEDSAVYDPAADDPTTEDPVDEENS